MMDRCHFLFALAGIGALLLAPTFTSNAPASGLDVETRSVREARQPPCALIAMHHPYIAGAYCPRWPETAEE